jgi:hypothetical protein
MYADWRRNRDLEGRGTLRSTLYTTEAEYTAVVKLHEFNYLSRLHKFSSFTEQSICSGCKMARIYYLSRLHKFNANTLLI